MSDFPGLLNKVISENLLDTSVVLYPEITQTATYLIRSGSDLRIIHQEITRSYQLIIQKNPYWYPIPLTLGGFFFGCYVSSDSGKYCSDTCAFSIPNFQDQIQSCNCSVIYFSTPQISTRIDSGTGCRVHLNWDLDPSGLTVSQISRLKEYGCLNLEVYQKGQMVLKGPLENLETVSSEQNVVWNFPEGIQPKRDIILVPTETSALNDLVNQTVVEPTGPEPINPGLALGIGIALILLAGVAGPKLLG